MWPLAIFCFTLQLFIVQSANCAIIKSLPKTSCLDYLKDGIEANGHYPVVSNNTEHFQEGRVAQNSESLASYDYAGCLEMSFSSSISKYQSCLDAPYLNRPVSIITRYSEQEEGEGLNTGCPTGEIKEQEEETEDDTFPITESMQALLRKLERLHNTKDENMISNNKAKITSSEPLMSNENNSAVADAKDSFDHASSETSAALNCLMSIEPLKKYFRGIAVSSSNNAASSSTKMPKSLQHFIKVFKFHTRSKNIEFQPELRKLTKFCKNSESNESCFEALKRILASLHEEIILAKKTGKIKRTCLRRCRQSTRANHSIISHIFRGHLKKRAECPCGHTNIRHEPFTSLPLSFTNFDNKTLVIPLTTYSTGGKCIIEKYLLRFNQCTTIANLNSKLYKLNPQKSSRIVIASVQDNDIFFIHDAASTVFDAMCKEGQLQAFESFPSNQDDSPTKEGCEEADYPYTSTPAVTDMSDIEDQERMNKITDPTTPRNELLAIPVVFKAHSHLTDDHINNPPAFVYLPKLIDGGKFSRVCSRLLGIPECDASRIYVSVKSIQDERCLLCSDASCSGCHLKASRTIAVGPACKIVAYMLPSMESKAQEILEHSTLVSGIPANIFSIEEGLASFRKQESSVICSACGMKQQVNVTRSVISYPDILVIEIDRNNSKDVTLTYPKVGFAPALSKSVRSRKLYNLSGSITSRQTFFGDNRKVTQYSFSNSTKASKIKDPNLPNDDTEILVYSKAQATIDKGRKKKTTLHHSINKPHRKKRVQSLSSSFHKDEPKEVISSAVPKEISRQNSAASCFSDGRSQKTTRDEDTASVCNCPRCQCLQKCAEQIRGSASTSIENLKLDEDQLNKLKESMSANTNTTVQLHRAILKQDLRRAVSLLKRGSDPNDLVDGIAAIHLAAGLQLPMGYFFTKLLIDHGADPNKKTMDGVTPVQLASMWNRSETLRFLSFHGGDLTTANDILEVPRRTNSTLSSVYSQTAYSPKDSPVKPKKRNTDNTDSPNYSEADLRLKSLIHLQRSLRESHEIYQEATGPADKFEHLKLRSINSMKETMHQSQQTEKEIAEDCESREVDICSIPDMLNSVNTSEVDFDFGYSDFSVGDVDDSVIPEIDEVDFPADFSSSTAPQAPSSASGNSHITILSTLDEENDTVIIYSPKSHITAPRSRFPYYLCCGHRRRKKALRNRAAGIFGHVRNYFRKKLERCRELIDALRGQNI